MRILKKVTFMTDILHIFLIHLKLTLKFVICKTVWVYNETLFYSCKYSTLFLMFKFITSSLLYIIAVVYTFFL